MARNCEKKLVGLNRMYIKEQQTAERIKNPKRPPLNALHSASDVKKWIPGIKKELDYLLEQLSGARHHQYPDRKIKEFEEKVAFLEKEYKRFVSKALQLDPSAKGIPWQPRGYVSKRKSSEMQPTIKGIFPGKIIAVRLRGNLTNGLDTGSLIPQSVPDTQEKAEHAFFREYCSNKKHVGTIYFGVFRRLRAEDRVYQPFDLCALLLGRLPSRWKYISKEDDCVGSTSNKVKTGERWQFNFGSFMTGYQILLMEK